MHWITGGKKTFEFLAITLNIYASSLDRRSSDKTLGCERPFQFQSDLVLQVGAKLTKRIRGHVRALQANSCISYVLLCDWPSHLGEQINSTFQFRNCHGKFFCSFWCIHGNNPRAVSVWGKRLHTKTSLPVGKRCSPMGKRANVTTTNVVLALDLWWD